MASKSAHALICVWLGIDGVYILKILMYKILCKERV